MVIDPLPRPPLLGVDRPTKHPRRLGDVGRAGARVNLHPLQCLATYQRARCVMASDAFVAA